MTGTATLFFLLAFCQPTPTDRPATSSAAKATAAAEAFLRGFQFLNLDDIMKSVDVPWFHDGKTVIHDRKELEDEFARLLDRYRGTPKMQFELKKQMTYGSLRDSLEPEERKLVDEVLRPEDFVQLVRLKNPQTNKGESIVLFVRGKEGEFKVVGLKN